VSIFTAGLTFAGIVALALAVAAFISVARDARFSGTAKLMWFVIVALFPILGSVVYFSVRSEW
jgi:hypothetical protein